jgi:hypothetical protein
MLRRRVLLYMVLIAHVVTRDGTMILWETPERTILSMPVAGAKCFRVYIAL